MGLTPEYGDDAFDAATVSRQLPRINKPVDAPDPRIWTGVQFPPSPLKASAITAEAFFVVTESDSPNTGVAYGRALKNWNRTAEISFFMSLLSE
jgi:hypothetical protein